MDARDTEGVAKGQVEDLTSQLERRCVRRRDGQRLDARRPFRAPLLAGQELKNFAKCAISLEGLSAAVGEVEADGRGIPVLLRQYAKLGGRVLTFNVDHDFAGALDGLMLTDLRTADVVALKKYMGAASFAAFQAGRALVDCDGAAV